MSFKPERQESNLGPLGFQASALAKLSYDPMLDCLAHTRQWAPVNLWNPSRSGLAVEPAESGVHDTHAAKRVPASNGPRHACPVHSPERTRERVSIPEGRERVSLSLRKAEVMLPKLHYGYPVFDAGRRLSRCFTFHGGQIYRWPSVIGNHG